MKLPHIGRSGLVLGSSTFRPKKSPNNLLCSSSSLSLTTWSLYGLSTKKKSRGGSTWQGKTKKWIYQNWHWHLDTTILHALGACFKLFTVWHVFGYGDIPANAMVLLLVLLHNQTTQESCVLVAFRLCACSRKAKSEVVRVPFSKISEVLVVELSQELEPSSCLD